MGLSRHDTRENTRTWHSRGVPQHLCISRERTQAPAAYSVHSEWRPNQYLKSRESGNFEVSPFRKDVFRTHLEMDFTVEDVKTTEPTNRLFQKTVRVDSFYGEYLVVFPE